MSKVSKKAAIILAGLAANPEFAKQLEYESLTEDGQTYTSITQKSKEQYVSMISDLTVQLLSGLQFEC